MAYPKETTPSVQVGSPVPSLRDVGSAKLRMLEVRKALEDFEALKGFASTPEHARLTEAFIKATETYLKLSANQR